jgi:cholesterol transport system auxiliary component
MSARLPVVLLLLVALAGCSMLAGRPRPVSHHVLLIPPGAAFTSSRDIGRNADVILLRDTEAPGVFQSVRLVYSRTPGALSYYQYARWAETPARSLNGLMRQRLNASGLFGAVVPLGAGVQAEYQLNTRLQDFFHDVSLTPGVARVTLEAELVSRRDARLIARQVFRGEAPVVSDDATGAASGLGQASGRALDDLVAWLARVRPVDAR